MKKYEITFIVGENFTEDKAREIAKDIRNLFESNGGKIEKDFYCSLLCSQLSALP